MELSGHVSKYSNSNHNHNPSTPTTTTATTCSSSSCMMSFGDNNTPSGAAMAMIMPFMSIHPHSHHHPHHNPNNHSPLFLPLPPPPPNNNNNNSTGSGSGSSMIIEDHRNNTIAANCFFMEAAGNNGNGNGSSTSAAAVRAKIMAHPLYHRLLAAYVSCQKVGAPPEVVGRLEEACAAAASMGSSGLGCIGEDPALDQFMEAYCEMLTKYELELSKPFKEAMVFLQRVESQFKAISLSSPTSAAAACGGDGVDWNALSDEEGDMNTNPIDPLAEDRELKCQLLRKYSGYLGSLKQEFLKKRKKGKLPKEARQQLLDWWTRHYKWPYPSESQKIALAEATGLDQKQINNWFINQRKRHWKPSEDMQFVVMDATHPHYYMENVLGNPYPMDLSPTML